MTNPEYYTLGKCHGLKPSPCSEELKAAYERIEELHTMLQEARLQLEYLHEKFRPTGTSEAVLARIDKVLS